MPDASGTASSRLKQDTAGLGYDAQTQALKPQPPGGATQKGAPEGPGTSASKAPLDPNAPVGANAAAPVVAPTGPTVATTKADFSKDGAALKAMTLGALYRHTQKQVDWATASTLTNAERTELWPIVHFAYQDETIRRACGDMSVAALVSKGLGGGVKSALERYAGAFPPRKDASVRLEQTTPDLEIAITWGQAISEIVMTLGGGITETCIPQAEFTQLMASPGAVADLTNFYATTGPLFHAENGAEIRSFLKMRAEGTAYAGMHAALPEVRSLHRFEDKALKTLEKNKADKSQKRPLAIILHSALDHNGAFHRDPNLTESITHPKNHTLMIEGPRTLDEAKGHIAPLAAAYGQKGKIDQVMIAGHGNEKSVELAGDATNETDWSAGQPRQKLKETDQALKVNDTKSDELFDEILKYMDPSTPNHRIALNSCLTGAANFDRSKLTGSTEPEREAQAKAALAANPSLAVSIGKKKKGIDALGANASFGKVGLIDSKTGKFELKSKHDPKMMADKHTYVREGREPVGCILAVVEVWTEDKAKAIKAMEWRLKNKQPGWEETIIASLYDSIVKNHPNDILMIHSMRTTASVLGSKIGKQVCRVPTFLRVVGIHPTELQAIFGQYLTINWASFPWIPLVVRQAWLTVDSSQGDKVLEALGEATFTALSAQDFVDLGEMAPNLGTLLGTAKAAGPAQRGQRILAILDLATGAGSQAARDLLKPLIPADQSVPADLSALASGVLDDEGLLIALGLKAAPKGAAAAAGPATVDANADLDHDGKNETYIAPSSIKSIIGVQISPYWDKPGKGRKELGKLPKDTLCKVVGEVDKVYAYEYLGQVVFGQDHLLPL